MDREGLQRDFTNRDDNAPELVHGSGSDGLIAAQASHTEGLEYAQREPSQGQRSLPAYNHGQSPNAYGHDEKLLVATGHDGPASPIKKPNKRKRMIWIILGAVLLALAVGLGVGLGIGLSKTRGGDPKGANQAISSDQDTSDPTTTPADPATTQTATATTSAVTSGSTGIAAFSCNSTATTHSSTSNTPYVQECYTQYQTNHPSFYSVDGNVTMRNLGGKITVYSFPACLDKCDAYNRERNVPACRAVTYYANLSWPIQQWGGNCFLKNDRGFGYQTDPVDYSHTASAYQECLNSTCWADG